MKYISLFLIFFCLNSCDYFDKKKVNADDLLNQELKTFNWNEVDVYPSFTTCDSSDVKEFLNFAKTEERKMGWG